MAGKNRANGSDTSGAGASTETASSASAFPYSTATARRTESASASCQRLWIWRRRVGPTSGPANRSPCREGMKLRLLIRSASVFAGLAKSSPITHEDDEMRGELARGVASPSPKKGLLVAGARLRVCSRRWQRAQSVTRSSSRLEPGTAWWTERPSVEPQRLQRFPSRSLAALRRRCQAERLSSGREDPERCGRVQAGHLPAEQEGIMTPQPGQTRASVTRRGDALATEPGVV